MLHHSIVQDCPVLLGTCWLDCRAFWQILKSHRLFVFVILSAPKLKEVAEILKLIMLTNLPLWWYQIPLPAPFSRIVSKFWRFFSQTLSGPVDVLAILAGRIIRSNLSCIHRTRSDIAVLLWYLHALSVSLLSCHVQPVRICPTLMSIMLYCFEQLMDCISQVEMMMAKVQGYKRWICYNNQSYLICKLSKFKQIKKKIAHSCLVSGSWVNFMKSSVGLANFFFEE